MNSILSVADKTLRTGHITMCTIHGGSYTCTVKQYKHVVTMVKKEMMPE